MAPVSQAADRRTDRARSPHRPTGHDGDGDTGTVTGAGEDFEDFVTARWRELHAVATVTTGDGDAGVRVTASALAALVDGGPRRPTRAAPPRRPGWRCCRPPSPRPAAGTPHARRPTSRPTRPTRQRPTTTAPGPRWPPCSPPTPRPLVPRSPWSTGGTSPALVATAAHTDVATVDDALAALRRRLAAAHADPSAVTSPSWAGPCRPRSPTPSSTWPSPRRSVTPLPSSRTPGPARLDGADPAPPPSQRAWPSWWPLRRRSAGRGRPPPQPESTATPPRGPP